MFETTRHRLVEGVFARILFALLFLTMSIFHPGAYGSPGNTLFHDGSITPAEQQTQAPSSIVAVSVDATRAQHVDIAAKSGKIADKNCKVHCAPMVALLVDRPGLGPCSGGCSALRMTPQFPSAEHASPIRPPRPLA